MISASRLAFAAIALCCAGCKTVIIKPAAAPECFVPPQLPNACVATATLSPQLTYGDLPEVALRARTDFLECSTSYTALLGSYKICTDQQRRYNQQLKVLEDELKKKYKDAEVLEQ